MLGRHARISQEKDPELLHAWYFFLATLKPLHIYVARFSTYVLHNLGTHGLHKPLCMEGLHNLLQPPCVCHVPGPLLLRPETVPNILTQ